MLIKCIKGKNAKKLYLENQMMLDCLSPTNVLTFFILFYFTLFFFSVSLLASLPGDKLTKIVDCLEVVSTTF